MKRFPVHLSESSWAAVVAMAEKLGISKAEAADRLIATGVSRRATDRRYRSKSNGAAHEPSQDAQ